MRCGDCDGEPVLLGVFPRVHRILVPHSSRRRSRQAARLYSRERVSIMSDFATSGPSECEPRSGDAVEEASPRVDRVRPRRSRQRLWKRETIRSLATMLTAIALMVGLLAATGSLGKAAVNHVMPVSGGDHQQVLLAAQANSADASCEKPKDQSVGTLEITAGSGENPVGELAPPLLTPGRGGARRPGSAATPGVPSARAWRRDCSGGTRRPST
jgi:hypothetical protein